MRIMPNPLTPPPPAGPLVVALLYDGLCSFEFGIAAEIFGLPRPEMGPGWYRFASCALEEGPLRAQGGLLVTPEEGPEALDRADLVVIPGWRGAESPVPEELRAKLREAHARGARLASICSGAFVLAAAGLLDGGPAATHWRYAEALRRRHPAVQVDEASLYRIHGRIFTSAGSAAGIDLLVEIVRRDFGPKAANSVARRLVMPAHRTGGQAQVLERPVALRPGTEVSPLLEKMRATLAEDWPLERMAREARMSRRTFLRRFAEAAGEPPGLWLAAARLEAAKTLLRESRAGLEEVAAACGFRSAEALRRQFRRRIGLGPAEWRAGLRGEG